VGFVASKRVGKAVKRNRAKRVLKAHFINQIDNLNSGYYILVAKQSILNSNYTKLQKLFFNVLKRINSLKQ
jgi:ribonuclease P protein component